MARWIPVSEQLPPANPDLTYENDVLLWFDETDDVPGGVYKGHLREHDDELGDRWVVWARPAYYPGIPKFWMPLPDPLSMSLVEPVELEPCRWCGGEAWFEDDADGYVILRVRHVGDCPACMDSDDGNWSSWFYAGEFDLGHGSVREQVARWWNTGKEIPWPSLT